MNATISIHEPTGLPHIAISVNDEIEQLYLAADAYDERARQLICEAIRIAKLGTSARLEGTRLLRAGMGGHL